MIFMNNLRKRGRSINEDPNWCSESDLKLDRDIGDLDRIGKLAFIVGFYIKNPVGQISNVYYGLSHISRKHNPD